MKFSPFYRIVFTIAMAALFPFALVAGEKETIDKSVMREKEEVFFPFQDSGPARKKTDKQHQPAKKPPQQTQDDRFKEADRRSIKQVPRSAPKLKPQPLTERIKVRKSG